MKCKRIFFFIFAGLIVGFGSFSQTAIVKGRVIDNNLDGVPASNVKIYARDSSILASSVTDNDGFFQFNGINIVSNVELEVSHLSYLTQKHILYGDTSIMVILQEDSFELDEVVVIGKKPAIEFKDGNLVANVSSIPNSSSLSLDKLLSRLPGVTATENEGLTLNGSSATLYIDGRKQVMPVSSIILMLQSLPAASIEQVELISISSGIYDASSGAIINLKTNKQRTDGYYLSLGGRSYLDTRNSKIDGGSNIFYMIKYKNILFNTTLSYLNNYYWKITNDSLIYDNGTNLISKSDYCSNRNTFSGIANLAWYFNNNHLLNFNTSYWGNNSQNRLEQPTKMLHSINDREYILESRGNNKEDFWTGHIEYSSPDSMERKIVASYGIAYAGLTDKNDYYNKIQTDNDKELYLKTKIGMLAFRHTGKLDYTQEMSKIGLKILTGLKADIGYLYDDVINTENNDNVFYSDSHFSGREIIYGGYVNTVLDLKEKWGINAAIRTEYTDYKIRLESDNADMKRNYVNYFPYLHIYYKHSKHYQTAFAFISKIDRPDYEYMIPGVRYSNEYSYSVGNPNLNPTLIKGLIWVHYLYGYGNINISYAHYKDVIGQVLLGKENGIREYSYLNYADGRNFNITAYLPFEFFKKKLNGNLNGSISHTSFVNPKNGFVIPEDRNSFWKWNIRGSINYKVVDNLIFNTWVGYNPAFSAPQYDQKKNWKMDLGIAYSLLKQDKLVVSLDMENLFNTNKIGRVYFYDGNVFHTNSRWSDRLIKLSCVFKFNKGEKIVDKARENVSDVSRFKRE